MIHILVCEDDAHIRRLMREYLEREHYQVSECINGEEAIAFLDHEPVDLLVTDVMMPGLDGFTLARILRDRGSEMPILMITAKDTIDDKKAGFSQGADDYMVKPIDMDEMVIRIQALLRRAKIASDQSLTVGETRMTGESLMVVWKEEMILLPKKEFMLMFKLLSNPGRIFTRRQLMDEIWGYDAESDERTVDVHIKRLREKFEHNRDFALVTVRGLGYKGVVLNP